MLRLLGRLPLPCLYLLSQLAYYCLYYLLRYRRPVVRNNLAQAFPDLPKGERRQLEQRFYRQLADVGAEVIRGRYMSHEEFARRVNVLNPDLLRQLSNDFQQSVIIMTIHQGNWEWLSHATSATLGVPLDPVYKPLHSPGADRFMREVRGRFGASPIPLADAAKDILRHRKRFRLLTLVADQSPIRRERSVWGNFMNRETAFHPGAESLARITGFTVVFARCRRQRRGYYSLEFIPLAAPPYDREPEHAITARYIEMAEQFIREEPESWLWSNQRWKRRRETEAC